MYGLVQHNKLVLDYKRSMVQSASVNDFNDSLIMRLTVVRLILFSVFFTAAGNVSVLYASSGSNQSSKQSERQSTEVKSVEDDDQEEVTHLDKSEEFDARLVGKSVDELSFLKSNQREFTSLTQASGSEAIKALAAISKCKKQKRSDSIKNLKISNSSQRSCFVVGKVNNGVVTNIDIVNAIKFICFSSGKQYDKETARVMAPQVVKTAVDVLLQQQYAELYSIKVSDNEVNRRVSEIAANNAMTIEELSNKFKEFGISMEIFKKHIKSRMLLQFIIQVIGEAERVTPQEMAEARRKKENDIKHRRFHLQEIFFQVDDEPGKPKVLQCAKSALKLLHAGFSFTALSEAMSQGTYSGDVGDLGWIREDAIEKPVLDAIKGKSPGEMSDIVETKTGYKIVYIVDIAEPGRDGRSRAKYKVLRSNIRYQGKFLMKKDMERINKALEEMIPCGTPKQFKASCKKYKIGFEEIEIQSPKDYEMELIMQSMKSGKPAAIQSMDNEDEITVVMYVSESVPNASPPTNDELFKMLSAKKIENEFNRNYKRMKAAAHSIIYTDSLVKVS